MKQKGWHRWSSEEHDLLLKNYRKIGDTKLAEMLNKNHPKAYPWTKKHVEKRRNYFGLKRTKEEEHDLRVANNGDGRHFKAWSTRGRAAEGEVRVWDGRPYIKVGNVFVPYFRHAVKAKKNQIVRTFEGGVRIITREENQRLNAEMRSKYSPELRETIKTLRTLKTLINGKENNRPKRNAV
ncbi:MAG: hypothetical protein KW793_03855 [Candidatus Doudnabacteria bacterium]|nr:hypothetical protein [Candidatus Doudnabacteria bacterium]